MSRIIDAFTQFLDDSGNPLISGKLRFFEVGTTTNKNTFADDQLLVPNPNPVILDGAGRCPSVFGQGLYKVVSFDSDDVQIQSFDPVGTPTTEGPLSGWENGDSYQIADIVRFNDQYYRSLINNNSNNTPDSSPSAWELLRFGRVWSSGVSYTRGDSVYASDGILYSLRSQTSINENPVSQIVSTRWVPQDELLRGKATGTVDAMVLDTGNGASVLRDGSVFYVTGLGENTITTPTLNVNSIGAKVITRDGGNTLSIGDTGSVDNVMILSYHQVRDDFTLLNPKPITADKDDQEAATDSSKLVTPLVQQYHPSSLKTWVSLNGVTAVVWDSYNVGSLVDNGTGNYTINFATPMGNTLYGAVATAQDNGSFMVNAGVTVLGTSSCQIICRADDSTLKDSNLVSLAIFGDM